ncbi:unnamed protein product [Calypogeia fissa]
MMGLPKPLGKYNVAFGDFELRRINKLPGDDTPYAPPFRVFYPTNAKQPGSWKQLGSRAWLPDLHYTWGFCCAMLAPSSALRRMILWVMASTIHTMVWPFSHIHASVGSPFFPPPSEDEESRLPVVIFSHGLWACRTTYSAFCCDLASHGYVVVAVEHLDGSANMAKYVDHAGKKKWLPYSFATTPVANITVDDRADQLNYRAKEITEVVRVLESLDEGLLTQGSNIVTSKTKLNVISMLHRLDLNHLAISGHSFGGATAVMVSAMDNRFKCCLGLDVWWEPMESQKLEFNKSQSRVPMILINTENFDWKALREARMVFLNARLESSTKERPLVTELMTIKGTVHQDQSDFPLIFKCVSKRMGFNGSIPPRKAKDVNIRACLEFLQLNLLPPGSPFPQPVEVRPEDKDYLRIENTRQPIPQ